MEVLDLLKATIPSSVRIESELQEGVKPVLADPTKLHETVLNLATNAVYAMKQEGTLTVRIYTKQYEQREYVQTGELEAGEYSVIEVADMGCDMDSTTMSKSFDPFFTTKGVGEGTGMGLSVVLGVVQSHGGNINVVSAVGKGTTFTIYLPAAESSISAARDEKPKKEHTGTEWVLFVDDEQMLIDMAEDELTYSGYKVTCFSNGKDALEFIKRHEHEIDILITDQTMPGLTGIELAREALNIRKDLPVILCTGFSTAVSPEKALQSGVRQCVLKPYNINDISRLIRTIIDNRKRES